MPLEDFLEAHLAWWEDRLHLLTTSPPAVLTPTYREFFEEVHSVGAPETLRLGLQ